MPKRNILTSRIVLSISRRRWALGATARRRPLSRPVPLRNSRATAAPGGSCADGIWRRSRAMCGRRYQFPYSVCIPLLLLSWVHLPPPPRPRPPRGRFRPYFDFRVSRISMPLIVRAAQDSGKLIEYPGDSQNVTQWVKYRRRKNRISQYLIRVLNRLGVDFPCTVFRDT